MPQRSHLQPAFRHLLPPHILLHARSGKDKDRTRSSRRGDTAHEDARVPKPGSRRTSGDSQPSSLKRDGSGRMDVDAAPLERAHAAELPGPPPMRSAEASRPSSQQRSERRDSDRARDRGSGRERTDRETESEKAGREKADRERTDREMDREKAGRDKADRDRTEQRRGDEGRHRLGRERGDADFADGK